MTTSSDDTDADLVRRARAGCMESLATLAARHQAAVVHYAMRLLGRMGCRADAEDVAQDALVRVLGGLARLEDERSFSAWLFMIVRRGCLNHLRTERRRSDREAACGARPGTPATDDPQMFVSAREEAARLWSIAARELPEQQFSALWLGTVEDLTVAEIARVLGRPPATVKVLLFRGRRRLAAALAERCTSVATPAPPSGSTTFPTRSPIHG